MDAAYYDNLLLIQSGLRVAAAAGGLAILFMGIVLWRGESLTGRVSNWRLAITMVSGAIIFYGGLNGAGLTAIGVGNASYVTESQAIQFYLVLTVIQGLLAAGLILAGTLTILTLRLTRWSGGIALATMLVIALLPGIAMAASPITPIQRALWMCAETIAGC